MSQGQLRGHSPLDSDEHFAVGVLLREVEAAQTWARKMEVLRALNSIRHMATQMRTEQNNLIRNAQQASFEQHPPMPEQGQQIPTGFDPSMVQRGFPDFDSAQFPDV